MEQLIRVTDVLVHKGIARGVNRMGEVFTVSLIAEGAITIIPKVGQAWVIRKLQTGGWIFIRKPVTGEETVPASSMQPGDYKIEASGRIILAAPEVVIEGNASGVGSNGGSSGITGIDIYEGSNVIGTINEMELGSAGNIKLFSSIIDDKLTINARYRPGVILPYTTLTPIPYTMGADGSVKNKVDFPDLWELWEDTGISFNIGGESAEQFRLPAIGGRMIVGYTSGDGDFNAIGDLGGSKTVALTAAQSGVPAHNHPGSGSVSIASDGGHAHSNSLGLSWIVGPQAGTGWTQGDGFGGDPSFPAATMSTAGAHTHPGSSISVTVSNSSDTNAASAHDNMSPFITFWYLLTY